MGQCSPWLFTILTVRLRQLSFSGLWALVNNAGIDSFGDVEFCTMDMYRRVAEVNLFGMVHVTKALLPLLRHSKGTCRCSYKTCETVSNFWKLVRLNPKNHIHVRVLNETLCTRFIVSIFWTDKTNKVFN